MPVMKLKSELKLYWNRIGLFCGLKSEPCFLLGLQVQILFNNDFGEVFGIQSPDQEERRMFLEDLITSGAAAEPPLPRSKQVRTLCISAFAPCKAPAIQSVLCGDSPPALLLVCEHQASANAV